MNKHGTLRPTHPSSLTASLDWYFANEASKSSKGLRTKCSQRPGMTCDRPSCASAGYIFPTRVAQVQNLLSAGIAQ